MDDSLLENLWRDENEKGDGEKNHLGGSPRPPANRLGGKIAEKL